MVAARLPGEGEYRVGSLTLPAGRPITGNDKRDHVAGATADPVPESGRVWAALSELHPQTGLVPIQLDGLSGDTRRPWDSGEFMRPEDPRGADGLDVGDLLQFAWCAWVPHPFWDNPEYVEMRSPFTLEWPGLAAPERAPLTAAERQHALDVVLPRIRQAYGATPEARIGLVAADRPADVLIVIGWDTPRGTRYTAEESRCCR
jgi:hypothetical protein